jgi:hypothetical protein
MRKTTLQLLDEEEDRLRAKAGATLTEIRRYGSTEFADRVEKYMREHDLLPRPEKQN